MLLWISFVVINFFSISVLWGIFWKERRSCYHSENLVRTRHTCPALLLTQKQRGHRKDRPRLSPPHLMDGTSEWVLFNPARSSLTGPQPPEESRALGRTLSSVTSPTCAHSSLHPNQGSSSLLKCTWACPLHTTLPPWACPLRRDLPAPWVPLKGPFPWSLSSADLTPHPPWLAAGTGHPVGTLHHCVHSRDTREFHLVPNLNSIWLTR